MSHEPAVTPPVTSVRRRWRSLRGHPTRRGGPGRRALAYAAGVVAATGLIIQACGDGGPTGATAATPPPKLEAPAPGALETAKGGGTKGAGKTFDPALVGELHNRGLDAVLAQARLAGSDDRASAKTGCTLIARLTTEYIQAERVRDPRLAAIGTGGLGDDALARITKDAACGAEYGGRQSLGDAALALTQGEERLEVSGDGTLSPAAVVLLNQVSDNIRWAGSAWMLDQNLMPLQVEAEALPDVAEQLLIRETIETARASFYYQEQYCRQGACGGTDRPPDATSAPPGAVASGERRAGVNHDVVVADAWGCILGGLRGSVGGPPGILSGCFYGGLAGSGGIIFRHLFT